MKENMIVYTYSRGVDSAEALQEDLDCRQITHAHNRPGSVRRIPPGTLVVNWGYGAMPEWALRNNVRFLNHPDAVARKMSKIRQLQAFVNAGVPTVGFTTDRTRAQDWLRHTPVLCRMDRQYAGQGITAVEVGGKLLDAHFYTKVFPKTHEYRFHVFNGEIIDIVQKKLQNGAKKPEDLTQQIVRNFANGWIEAHYNLFLPEAAKRVMSEAAIEAVKALNLDFGAVDIIAEFREWTLKQIAVCEVNTAPGLGEMERKTYVEAIKKVYEAR